MMEKTIQLSRAYTVHGAETDVIVLREPKGKDVRKHGNEMNSVGGILDFASTLSGWPPSAIDELSFSDTGKLVEELACFLDSLGGAGIAAKPSP